MGYKKIPMGSRKKIAFVAHDNQTRISDLKIGDKSVEDMRRLCSCVNRAHGSLPEVDTQWVRAKISPFNFRSTGFCASIFKDRG